MVYLQTDNHPGGFSIDIWERVGRALSNEHPEWQFAFVDCPTISGQIEALAKGDLDIVISPLTITAERMDLIDFSVGYLQTGLTVLRQNSVSLDIEQEARSLLKVISNPLLIWIAIVFLVLSLLLALVLYSAARKRDHPNTTPRHGAEFIMRILGARGTEGGGTGFAARTLELLLSFLAAIVSTAVIGIFSTHLVVAMVSDEDIVAADLLDLRTVTLSLSSGQAFVETLFASHDQPIECAPFEPALQNQSCVTTISYSDALDLIQNQQADVLVGDWIALSYLSRTPRYEGELVVQQQTISENIYAWGLSPKTVSKDLRNSIDKELIRMMRQPEWRRHLQNFLGDGFISPG